MGIISQIESMLEPFLAQNGMELVDLQLITEHGKKVLRVFIDKEGGISLSDCETMSGKVGDMVDESGIIKSSYVLEISSPGLNRVLKKEKDFARFRGKKAKITLFAPLDGQRNFCGEILSAEQGSVTINDVTGKTVAIPIEKMASARLEPEL